MQIDPELSLLQSLENIDGLVASGQWSGMITAILDLGSRNSGGDFDLAVLEDLFAVGLIDAFDDGCRPVLTQGGLAAYEYLTRI